MKKQLICISGPDGTGKTTQVELLISLFKKEGLEYEYRWLRFNHLFSLPVLGIARVLGLSETMKLDTGEKIGFHYFYNSKIISVLYTITLLLDTVILTFFEVYIPLKFFKKKLICDRFIYDTVVDLMISTGNSNLYKSLIGKLFLSLIPPNSLFIFLITDAKTLKSRREDIFYDKCLEDKIKLYNTIVIKKNLPKIDATLPIETIQKKITTIINKEAD